MARSLAPLDRTRQLNGTTKQQQLFSQGGLARIRMGNYGKSAATRHFVFETTHIYQGKSQPKEGHILPDQAREQVENQGLEGTCKNKRILAPVVCRIIIPPGAELVKTGKFIQTARGQV